MWIKSCRPRALLLRSPRSTSGLPVLTHASVRVAAVIIVIALMAAVAVWLLLSDGAGAGPPGQPQSAGAAPSEAPTELSASETPSETASEPQSTALEETRAERLARLRKTDAFVEFANWDRARTAPNYERAVGDFAWYDPNRDGYVRFINAKQLWNKVVAPIRDDLLLQGDEYRGRLLGGRVSGPITGPYVRRAGDAQLIGFLALYRGRSTNPLDRVHAVLVDVDSDQASGRYARGRVVAFMKPFSVDPGKFDSLSSLAADGISPRIRAWADRQSGD